MIEVCIIRTDENGKRTATLLVDGKPGGPVPFLYRYLRETRRADAPTHFRFSVMDKATLAWAEKEMEGNG